MQKIQIENVVLIVTLANASFHRSWESVAALGVAVALLVLLRFIDRKRRDDLAGVLDEITRIKNQLEHLQLGKSFGRTPGSNL